MMERILVWSVRRRWLVVLMTVAAVISGAWSLTKLPIDAVPDVTNVQVQINTRAPGLSPLESEQRITFPIETAMGGLPRLDYTRSISRYGPANGQAAYSLWSIAPQTNRRRDLGVGLVHGVTSPSRAW